ncbi:hypothetical protein JCM31598_15660 [Desulfonatronum parangueonense]
MLKTYTAEQLANMLQKPKSWVYKHKQALGGFQPCVGGSLLFFEKKIWEFIDNAVSTKKRDVAGVCDGRGRTQEQGLLDKKGGEGMGAKSGKTVARVAEERHDPHGIFGDLGDDVP